MDYKIIKDEYKERAMDYKEAWERLKEIVESDLEYFKNGGGCSWIEAALRATGCEDVLEMMRVLENDK